MQLKYSHTSHRFYCLCSYDDRAIPKEAGFIWSKDVRKWVSTDPRAAEKLLSYADDETKQIIEVKKGELAGQVEASKATDADINIPHPDGLDYLPFQKAGVSYAMDRKNTLIADEMGLGKTIQAIGAINATGPASVLIVCPASLKLNWRNELVKWLTHQYKIAIVNESEIAENAEILICNYDIIAKHKEITGRTWGLLIADECHYGKNPKSLRSKALYSIRADRKLFLTGTPILNRPSELIAPLKYLGFPEAQNWYRFVSRYCDGKSTRWGWDVSGASNLEELQEKLRAWGMVRRLKKDVLKELPAKRRQIVEIAKENGLLAQIEKEKRFMSRSESELEEIKKAMRRAKAEANEGEYREAVARLKDAKMAAFTEMSVIRHETALKKVPKSVEQILNTVEATGKVVVFAHHRDVIEQIGNALKEAGVSVVQFIGDMGMDDRQKAVEDFQNTPIQVFLASIHAAGVGITLTASSNVIFVELDWTPANMSQAEDRCHRIGQADSVLVQHIVVDESIDSMLAKKLVEKQEIIDRALNADDGQEPVEVF